MLQGDSSAATPPTTTSTSNVFIALLPAANTAILSIATSPTASGTSSASTIGRQATGQGACVPANVIKSNPHVVFSFVRDMGLPSTILDTTNFESVHAYLRELLDTILLPMGCPYHLLEFLSSQEEPYTNHLPSSCAFYGSGCYRWGFGGHSQANCSLKFNMTLLYHHFEFCFFCSTYMKNDNHLNRAADDKMFCSQTQWHDMLLPIAAFFLKYIQDAPINQRHRIQHWIDSALASTTHGIDITRQQQLNIDQISRRLWEIHVHGIECNTASLTPTSLNQCLDHLSRQLINFELRNEEELALKLSWSHIICLVGGAIMPIANTFFGHQTEPMKATCQDLNSKKPILPKRLSDAMSKMYDEVLVAPKASKKNARVYTLLKRVEYLQSDQENAEIIQLLNILDYVIYSDFTKENKSTILKLHNSMPLYCL